MNEILINDQSNLLSKVYKENSNFNKIISFHLRFMLNQPNPQDSSPHSFLNTIGKQRSLHQDYVKSLRQILPIFQIQHEQRSTQQLNKTHKILQKIKFFKTLQNFSSQQLIKNLIKHGKLLRLSQNSLICQKDSLLNNFIIVLQGQFGIVGEFIEKPVELYQQESYESFFEEFKNFSPSYLGFLKKKQQLKAFKTLRSQKVYLSQQQISQKFKPSSQNQYVLVGQKIFMNKNQQKKYAQTIITKARQNFIFSIDFKKICELMRQEYNKSLTKQINILQTFSCFNLFKKEKLRQIVEGSQKIKLKKNDILFKQGQQDNRIFILKTGQITLQKTATLNQQNPNELYKNRLNIKRQQHGKNLTEKIQSIPFVDFTKVFNSASTKKKIRLTCLSPNSILGEQEIISKKLKRQTTAKVISHQAELFVFTVNLIEKLIPINSNFTIDDFLKILEQQITNKKILYRQQKLGNDIIYLNKTNKNGFFLHNEAKIQSLKKRKSIHSLNKTFSIQKKKTKESQQSTNHLFVTASYTCHNFQDFYHTQYQDQFQQTQKKQQKNFSKEKKNQQDEIKYTNEQKQIIKLLHGNQRSNEVNRKKKFGRSQNQFQCKIDFEKPLFSAEYFRQHTQKSRKLEKDLRKSKLQCLYSKSTQSTFFQSRKYKTLSTSILPNSLQKKSIKRNLSSQK